MIKKPGSRLNFHICNFRKVHNKFVPLPRWVLMMCYIVTEYSVCIQPEIIHCTLWFDARNEIYAPTGINQAATLRSCCQLKFAKRKQNLFAEDLLHLFSVVFQDLSIAVSPPSAIYSNFLQLWAAAALFPLYIIPWDSADHQGVFQSLWSLPAQSQPRAPSEFVHSKTLWLHK